MRIGDSFWVDGQGEGDVVWPVRVKPLPYGYLDELQRKTLAMAKKDGKTHRDSALDLAIEEHSETTQREREALLCEHITDWTQIEDAEGDPIECTPDAVKMVIHAAPFLRKIYWKALVDATTKGPVKN